MARTNNLTDFLTDVADAIRTAEGSSETIQASDFDTRIEALSGGGVDLDDYLQDNIYSNSTVNILRMIKKTPSPLEIGDVVGLDSLFQNCVNLVEAPMIDFTNIQSCNRMFRYCYNLKIVPLYDLSNVYYATDMFMDCRTLNDNSLYNILQMCINTVNYADTKTLYKLGFRSNYYPTSRIQALSNYQDFINAGWTIGY